jgi:hypothetical protein
LLEFEKRKNLVGAEIVFHATLLGIIPSCIIPHLVGRVRIEGLAAPVISWDQ